MDKEMRDEENDDLEFKQDNEKQKLASEKLYR